MPRGRTPHTPGFDVLVLSVANDVQRRYAERMLDLRARLGALPPGLETVVLADPAGRRIGSGGSTLLCLQAIAANGGIAGRRALVLHSGGDSRRLPSWSAMGKIWVPLERRGRTPESTKGTRESTVGGGGSGAAIGPAGAPALFDLILTELSRLALPASGGVVVASGDAALRLDGERITFGDDHATVLTFPGDAARASRHGVFVFDRTGCVRRTLQKPSRTELSAARALDARGRAQVDSGIFHFPPSACDALLRGARGMLAPLGRGEASLDLYQEIADALAADATTDSYLARFAAGRDPRRRELAAFFRAAHAIQLRACRLSAGRFLHLGSTRELVDRLASSEPQRLFPDLLSPRDARSAERNPALEHGPRAGLPSGIAKAYLRIGASRWCCALHGIDDDCKSAADAGGTVCNRPLSGLAARTGLDDRAIWGTNPRTLWHARIHPIAGNPADAWAAAQWLARGGKAPRGWHALRRASFAQLMSLANPDAAADAAANAAWRSLPDEPSSDPLARARAIAAGTVLAPSPEDRAACRAAALAAVGDAVSTDIPLPPVVRRFAVRPDQAVWASAPVRIDLAGGWSDTPPLCIEHGGAVVNAALTLGGTLPLQAMARVTEEPAISLHSVDAGRTARYSSVRQLLDHHDPRAWDALPRAALVLSGLVPRDPDADLGAHLRRAGGGLAITLFSAVPRGSGLGTSSILGATLLATLDRIAGREADPARLARGASLLEQMIRTRGGWQDQVGGLWGGIKLSTTAPGRDQVPRVAPLDAPPAFARALHERAILFYSGRRRMARDILETVVLRSLRGEGAVADARRRLVAGAHLMADAVRAGDLDEFAARLAEYRDLKRAVDPASVTPDLEQPMHALGADLHAWSFAGAGGGGFLLLVCRSAAAADRVRKRLSARPPHPLARAFPVELDHGGLRVAVL